jgi:hypothetical protein
VGEDAFGGWMRVLYGWFMLGNCCAFCGLNIFAGAPRGDDANGNAREGARARADSDEGEGPGSRWRPYGRSWDPSSVQERKGPAMKKRTLTAVLTCQFLGVLQKQGASRVVNSLAMSVLQILHFFEVDSGSRRSTATDTGDDAASPNTGAMHPQLLCNRIPRLQLRQAARVHPPRRCN